MRVGIKKIRIRLTMARNRLIKENKARWQKELKRFTALIRD
jgi:hypothetical protein